jgi:HPt (histidine-containing phosphotransfer) domain-containing protein
MSEPIIDQATFDGLKEMVGDDFVDELVETYLEDSPDLLADLHQALDDGDAGVFRRTAHSLKSTSASMGALNFAALARELENIGQEERLDEARPLLAQLEASYEQVAQALKDLS